MPKWPDTRYMSQLFDVVCKWPFSYDLFCLLGPIVEYVGESKLPYGMVPIMLYNGEITLQTQSGRIQTQILDTHTALYTESLEDMTVEEVCQICDHSMMYNLLSLCYFI